MVCNDKFAVPDELTNFWMITNSAQLFKDVQYGQWGLNILSYTEAIKFTQSQKNEYPHKYFESDLIIGRFIGDSELLVISLGDENFAVFVSLPLYDKNDRYSIANSFLQFLEKYSASEGDKYWEST